MPLNVNEIVAGIGDGVVAALRTSELFLGIEQFEFENADIHPEYVTTVEVAEKLTGPDRVVSLEAHMRTLRHQALGLVRLRRRPDDAAAIAHLRSHVFGKKDSQRLDILVRSSDPAVPPLLMVEAKLGIRKLAGVLADVDRIVKVLSMYQGAQLDISAVYGAVVFHLMEEGGTSASLGERGANFLTGINAHLANHKLTRPWLQYQAGLLSRAKIIQGVSGYQEYHDDGSVEDVFAKNSFAFAPGLVLLGAAADVTSVKL